MPRRLVVQLCVTQLSAVTPPRPRCGQAHRSSHVIMQEYVQHDLELRAYVPALPEYGVASYPIAWP